MSESKIRVFAIFVGLGMVGGILTTFYLHPLTAREVGDVAASKRDVKEELILKTRQAKLIKSLFKASEELHLEALKVGDLESFAVYKVRIMELEKSIRTILGELKKEMPLSQDEQAELRKLLKEEEVRIGNVGEEASIHTAGIKNVLLGQEMQKVQKELTERLAPLVIEQSKRHYKPPVK